MSKEQVSGSLTLSLGGLADEVAGEVVTRLASTLRKLAEPEPNVLGYGVLVGVLANAMPELGSPGGGLYFDRRDVAAQMARRLWEHGLAVIQLPDGSIQEVPPTSNATPGTEPESAAAWFEREVNQP